MKPERVYRIAGWERAANGVYWKGKDTLCQCGRKWVRDDGTEYPTLHAAIHQTPGPVETGRLILPPAENVGYTDLPIGTSTLYGYAFVMAASKPARARAYPRSRFAGRCRWCSAAGTLSDPFAT